MEILMVCLAEFDCDPALLAEAVCSREVTRRQQWDVHCSGDAQSARCAEAFCNKMRTRLFVDYRWDDPHTAARPEPPRLPNAQYLCDWFQEEDDAAYNTRLTQRFTDNIRNRLVLCSRKVMTLLNHPDAAVYQFQYTLQSSQPVDTLSLEDLRVAVARLSEQREQQRVRVKAMERLRLEVPELAQKIVATVYKALQPLSVTVDVAPLLQQLTAAVVADLQDTVKRLEELYQLALVKARETVEETMKKCNEEFCRKMEEMNARIQGLEKQQKEAIQLIDSLKKTLSSTFEQQLTTESVTKKLESLEASTRLYDRKVHLLYEGLPAARQKRPPLTIKLEEDFSLVVTNRKKYTVEGAAVELRLEGREAARTYLPAKSYPPGTATEMLEVPGNMQGKVRIVLKQENAEVSDSVTVTLEELDHSMRARPSLR